MTTRRTRAPDVGWRALFAAPLVLAFPLGTAICVALWAGLSAQKDPRGQAALRAAVVGLRFAAISIAISSAAAAALSVAAALDPSRQGGGMFMGLGETLIAIVVVPVSLVFGAWAAALWNLARRVDAGLPPAPQQARAARIALLLVVGGSIIVAAARAAWAPTPPPPRPPPVVVAPPLPKMPLSSTKTVVPLGDSAEARLLLPAGARVREQRKTAYRAGYADVIVDATLVDVDALEPGLGPQIEWRRPAGAALCNDGLPRDWAPLASIGCGSVVVVVADEITAQHQPFLAEVEASIEVRALPPLVDTAAVQQRVAGHVFTQEKPPQHGYPPERRELHFCPDGRLHTRGTTSIGGPVDEVGAWRVGPRGEVIVQAKPYSGLRRAVFDRDDLDFGDDDLKTFAPGSSPAQCP